MAKHLSPLPEYTSEQWNALTPEERQAHVRCVVSVPTAWTRTFLALAVAELDKKPKLTPEESVAYDHIENALRCLGLGHVPT